ncbi:calcium-binding protein [uncultured Tateyamaria sp.]|uniref:calcium-binding protein n=1 Tax=Tateyamaria sp. 1078 TaxID=3417464 RepID=UPI002617ED09|nr:calcium-binding protein [uncultured Tateyamaria sp.]
MYTPGNDTETELATVGMGQNHFYAKGGDDTIDLDFGSIDRFSYGHHGRGDNDGSSIRGSDTFNFVNLQNVDHVVVGRLEDFDLSRDKLRIGSDLIEENDLLAGSGTTGGYNWRIVEYDSDTRDDQTATQQWLLIDTGQGYVFYALEGARVTDGNGGSNSGDQESHFVGASLGHRVTASELASLETVGYIDPQNHVPFDYSTQTGITYIDDDNQYLDSTDVIAHGVEMHTHDDDPNDPATFNNNLTLDLTGDDLIAAGLNDDAVNAGEGNDTVWGGSGNDTINGGNGNDSLSGNIGDDSLIAENGNDTIDGGHGNDYVQAGTGQDLVYGGDGNDWLSGWGGHDTIYGGNGNDALLGGNNADSLFGEVGADRLFGEAGVDFLDGGSGNDTLWAGSENDTVNGGSGNDLVHGDAHDDIVNGGAGNDTVYGDGGFDTINGNSGNDFLIGGMNWDVFVFNGQFGNDTINDFDVANSFEVIDLSGVSEFTSFTDLQNNHLTEDGSGNAIIDDGAGNQITLLGVSMNSLTSSDFIF